MFWDPSWRSKKMKKFRKSLQSISSNSHKRILLAPLHAANHHIIGPFCTGRTSKIWLATDRFFKNWNFLPNKAHKPQHSIVDWENEFRFNSFKHTGDCNRQVDPITSYRQGGWLHRSVPIANQNWENPTNSAENHFPRQKFEQIKHSKPRKEEIYPENTIHRYKSENSSPRKWRWRVF